MLIRSSRTGVISAPRWFPFVSNASRTPFNTQVDREKFLLDSAEPNGRAHASGGRRRRKPRGARARARRSDVRARPTARTIRDARSRAFTSVRSRFIAPRVSAVDLPWAFPGMPRASLALGVAAPRGNLGLVTHTAECRMVLALPSRRRVRPCRRTRSRSGVTRGRCVSSSGNFQGSRTLKFHEGGGNTQISQTIDARVTNDTRKEQDRTRRRRTRHSDRTRHDRVRSQPIDG